jgi:NAD(P)-dependent dehydrogenase (short-subunit alcohol dehydrogenase family)
MSSKTAAISSAPRFPIRRVVGPADVAALAVHIMTNTALTGATYDVDGGQQLVEG